MKFFRKKENKTKHNHLEIEEIFLDDFLKKRGENSEVLERKIESPLKKRIFWLFSVFGIGIFLFLIASSFNLQILSYEKYNTLSLGNKFLNLQIKAERGVIYDRNMTQLVFNTATFDLYSRLSKLPEEKEEREKVLTRVSEITNLPLLDLKEKIKENSQDLVLLSENLPRLQLILIETQIENLPGIEVKKRIERNYVPEESLSHILGYLGKISAQELENLGEGYEIENYVGKEGLEKQYEKTLAEIKGVLEIERDVNGRVISQKIKQNPSSGNSLVLTLDLDLQKKITQTLREILNGGEGTAAASLVLDPRSGEILASVSLPTFDNNLFAQGISQEELKALNEDPKKPQLNRVIGGVYPIGSTIKPLIGIAALEEEIIKEETTFFCPLELCLEHKYTKELECYSDWKFHGLTSIKRAIAESINPFFYIIGGGYEAPKSADPRLVEYFEGLGSRKIAQWLRKFNWGEKTGIDLPGEVTGRVPDPEWKENYFSDRFQAQQIWYLGDTYNLAIGQGYILVTPIQVAVAFQAIANQGKIFKPRLVKKNLFSDEEIEIEILKEIFINPESIEIVREGMRRAVVSPSGSAFFLNDSPVKVAVKTGTAQTSIKDVYHNWITLFAPYEESEILLVIVIENVKELRVVAQKAAKEIIEWYFGQN